jgi:hypothetical protein
MGSARTTTATAPSRCSPTTSSSRTPASPRAHGGTGAFVSKWVIRKDDLSVVSGQDLIQQVDLWNGSAYVPTANVRFTRFCSADLAPKSAFFNDTTGKGYDGRLLL